MDNVILSCFSGIGMLDSGFKEQGYTILCAPERLLGGDIRDFHMPAGLVEGVIGGSPCQTFSKAYRGGGSVDSMEMLLEFLRVVHEAQPDWFLLENVPQVPNVHIEGYTVQRLNVWSSEFGLTQKRNRHFQFGCKDGSFLVLPRGERPDNETPVICASDSSTPTSRMAEAQGLPKDFKLPYFRRSDLRRAIGNGVSIPVSMAMANAIRNRHSNQDTRVCACGCGREVTGKANKKTATDTCRSRYRYQKKNNIETVYYP